MIPQSWISHGYVKHFFVALFAGLGLRLAGVEHSTTAKLGSFAIVGVEVGQAVTRTGTPETGDLIAGFAGLTLALLGSPNPTPDPFALDLRRINKALRAECDSVRTHKKTFADSSMREFAKRLCH